MTRSAEEVLALADQLDAKVDELLVLLRGMQQRRERLCDELRDFDRTPVVPKPLSPNELTPDGS